MIIEEIGRVFNRVRLKICFGFVGLGE